MRILLVEDEESLREGLFDLLSGAGYDVEAAEDGPKAVELGLERKFDLVLLDLMLPGIDGIEVCLRLRQAKPTLPVLMLTARGAEEEKVRGFEAGADDYLCKPFGARELLARVNAFDRRRRAEPSEPEIVEEDGCIFDLGRHVARRKNSDIPLTPREVGILRWLYRHRFRAVSRGELLESVWSASGDLQTRTVDMTVAKLRQKIERHAADPCIVVTVTGIGYAWGKGQYSK